MEGVSREQVKDYIKNMTLMDAATLVKELEEELGVSAAAPVAVAAAAGPAAAAAEEKTEFNVILAGAGEKKIQVIKVVRELTYPATARKKVNKIFTDLDYQTLFYKEKLRRQNEANEAIFREKLRRIVFDCCFKQEVSDFDISEIGEASLIPMGDPKK